MVFLLPTLAALKKLFPQARATLVCGPYSAAKDLIVLGHLIDQIRIVDWVHSTEQKRRQINAELAAEKFEVCFSTCSNPVRFFLPLLATIPHRAGEVRDVNTFSKGVVNKLRHLIWEEEFYRYRVFNYPLVIDGKVAQLHDIEKGLSLLGLLGLPVDAVDRHPSIYIPDQAKKTADQFLKERVATSMPLLGFSVGVSKGMEWKIWDMKKMALLAARLCDEKKLTLVFFGGSDDQPLLEEFKKHFTRPFIDLVNKTSILEMAALIARCQMFLSNDSGPSKVAMALRVPTVTIWGPSDRAGAGPWDKNAGHVTVANGIACSPCFVSGLTLRGPGVLNHSNCGHHGCLNYLTVDEDLIKSRPL